MPDPTGQRPDTRQRHDRRLGSSRRHRGRRTSSHAGSSDELDPLDLPAGATFGSYTIQGKLGEGGFSTVYRAHDHRLDRQVALKILTHANRGSGPFAERFLREAQATARLMSPHLVVLFDSGEFQGHLYMATEFVAGGDLQQLVRQQGQLTTEKALFFAGQVTIALQELTDAGLTHCDIKPSNIYLDHNGNAKLGDLGLARLRAESMGDELSESGKVTGTPAFMSPEQALGRPMDIRSDIYSLGATLFEMLAGRPPFVGDNPYAVAIQLINEQPPHISSLRPDIDDKTALMLHRMLAKTPEERYQTPAELMDVLLEVSELDFSPRTTMHRRSSKMNHGDDPGRASSQRSSAVLTVTSEATASITIATRRVLSSVNEHRGKVMTALGVVVVALLLLSDDQPSGSFVDTRQAADGDSGIVVGSQPSIGEPPRLPDTTPVEPDADTVGGAELTETTTPTSDPSDRTIAAASTPLDPWEPPPADRFLTIDPATSIASGSDALGRIVTITVDEQRIDLRPVAPGRFVIGADDHGPAGAPRGGPVSLTHGYWIATTEITQAVYQTINATNPSAFMVASASHRMPVEHVSWSDAERFCHRLGQRLGIRVRMPSEAEFEYASIGGDRGNDHDHLTIDRIANVADRDSDLAWRALDVVDGHPHGPAPVATYLPNRLGLYDLQGNVAEWCLDAWRPYPLEARDNPVVSDGLLRIARGGSWALAPNECQWWSREGLPPQTWRSDLGFRIVVEHHGLRALLEQAHPQPYRLAVPVGPANEQESP